MSEEKVKELLSSGDYDTIDKGIQVAIDLNDSKIFEKLLQGCKMVPSNHFKRDNKFLRPKLNDLMKETMISGGKLNSGTGYYIFLSLWLNSKDLSGLDESLNKDVIKNLSLVNCKLSRLPSSFKSLINLQGLDLSENIFSSFPEEISFLKQLKYLIINDNSIENISFISNHLKELRNLKVLLASNCNENEGLEETLDWTRTPIPEDFSINIEKIDLGLDYESRNLIHTACCGACGYEFHKSSLIIRDDRLNCIECDDSDEIAFSCEICSKYIAPYVSYEMSEEDNNLFFEYNDYGYNDDNYDIEQNQRAISTSDNPIVVNVCLDCSENIKSITEKDFNKILGADRCYTDRYGDEQFKTEFYLISSIKIDKEDIKNSTVNALDGECYYLSEVAEWNDLRYENSSGEVYCAWNEEEEIGMGDELIQCIHDDDKDLKNTFISLIQDMHGDNWKKSQIFS